MIQKKIAKVTSDYFGVEISELQSPSRQRRLAWPRHICMYLADNLKVKKSDIGRFWKRDRTAVYNAVMRVEAAMETDKKLLKEIKNISSDLIRK